MSKKTSRVVIARRTFAVAAAAGVSATVALAETPVRDAQALEDDLIILAQADGEGEAAQAEGEGEGLGECAARPLTAEGEATASGEGEGEGEAAASGEGEGEAAASGENEGEGVAGTLSDAEQRLQRDMSFMEGHLRAGLTLYEAGDLSAAKTHMGHPLKEKYNAVAKPLEQLGCSGMRDQIEAIAAAAEAEAPYEEVEEAFDDIRATMEQIRGVMSPKDQVIGLAALVRVAGDEYTVAVEGGQVSNLHEYQDSWGFLRVVEAEAQQMAESDDAAAAEVGREILEHVAAADTVYGDIQGEGEFEMDPSILYGAAARIELAGLRLD